MNETKITFLPDEEIFKEAYERLKAQQKMQWQPIETAPKDGSAVLAWREDWELPSWVKWRENSRTKTTFWNDVIEEDCYELESEPPTHWLPIPPLPTK